MSNQAVKLPETVYVLTFPGAPYDPGYTTNSPGWDEEVVTGLVIENQKANELLGELLSFDLSILRDMYGSEFIERVQEFMKVSEQ